MGENTNNTRENRVRGVCGGWGVGVGVGVGVVVKGRNGRIKSFGTRTRQTRAAPATINSRFYANGSDELRIRRRDDVIIIQRPRRH